MTHKVIDFAIQLAVILFAISFHESAHAWSALQFGDTTARDQGRISLNPLRHIDPFGSVLLPLILYIFSGMIFGAAKPTPVDLRNTRNPRLANLVVSAAGPVSNLLLAGIGIGLLVFIRRLEPRVMADLLGTLQGSPFTPGILAPIAYLLFFFAMVNVSLAVFNLIPIPPLDGANVVYGLLPPRQQYSWRTYQQYGPFLLLFILILLISTPVLGKLFRPIQGIVVWLIFGA